MAVNYYLGVKTVKDAAHAVGQLPFVKVLDASALEIQVAGIDRISLTAGPASSDDDLSKGLMIIITGNFTADEINAIERLSGFANPIVTRMISKFVTKQAVEMQSRNISGTHIILGQSYSNKKWWKFWA